MPDLEAENKDLKTQIETIKGEYEGKLAKMQADLDTATSHSTEIASRLKHFEDMEEEKRKAIRKENEAKVHAVPKYKDEDLSKWADERLNGFVIGLENAPKAHSTQAPPAGDAGTPSQVPKTAADRLKMR